MSWPSSRRSDSARCWILPVEPALRVAISSVLGVQKSQCTGCGLAMPLSCVGCPSIGSLKQCLATDILAHLLEQIGQAAEPAAHRSINRRVHPKQSPSRRATTSAPSPSPGSWSPREVLPEFPSLTLRSHPTSPNVPPHLVLIIPLLTLEVIVLCFHTHSKPRAP